MGLGGSERCRRRSIGTVGADANEGPSGGRFERTLLPSAQAGACLSAIFVVLLVCFVDERQARQRLFSLGPLR